MRYVALAWQVYSLTGSSVAVGLLGLAEVIPLIVLTMFAGALADSGDRKKIMMWSQIASMGVSVALTIVALTDNPALWLLYALAALGATFDALDRPSRQAVIPSLVGVEKIAAALALRQITFQLAQILGPALGGLAIASLSLAAVYALDAATFVASLISLRPLPPSRPEGETRRDAKMIVEGLRFSLGRPLIRSVFAIDLIAMVFGMPRAVFPALAENVFHMGAEGVGILYAAPSVGALLGALFSGWVGRISRYGRAIFIIVAVWGASISLAGVFAFSLPLLLIFLVIAGIADVLSAVFRGTLVQETTPDALRGRVTAVNQLVVVGGPRLGDVEAGFAAAALGPRGSVISGGLACLVGIGLLWLKTPQLKQYVHRQKMDEPLEKVEG